MSRRAQVREVASIFKSFQKLRMQEICAHAGQGSNRCLRVLPQTCLRHQHPCQLKQNEDPQMNPAKLIAITTHKRIFTKFMKLKDLNKIE